MKKDYYALEGDLQLIDIIPAYERYIFCKWAAVKYLVRGGRKTADARDDLFKAIDFINKMIETCGMEDSENGRENRR